MDHSFPIIKDTIHFILNPTVGRILEWNISIGMLIIVLGFKVNSIVATAIASSLAIGSIAIFNFADNLRWVPIGIIGVAFSTAAFPAMSLAYAQGKKDLFLKRFSLAVRQTFFIVIPISLVFLPQRFCRFLPALFLLFIIPKLRFL